MHFDPNLIAVISAGTPIGIGAIILFVLRGMRSDVKRVASDLQQFKNGHLEHHENMAESRGLEKGRREAMEQMFKVLYDKVDKIEGGIK